MALDDFANKDSYSRGDVSSRKKIQNLKLNRKTWHYLLSTCHRPIPEYDYDSYSDNELMCVIEFIDEEMEDSSPFGLNKDDSHIDRILEFRENLAEELRSR